MIVDRLCWNITNRCNDHCSFCFRNEKESELALIENIIIAEKIAASNISHIAFSGGEALLYPELHILIKILKKSGKLVTLISNCILLNEQLLLYYSSLIDWIAIPFDTINYDGINTRNINHAKNAIQALNIIESQTSIYVKINTVLSEMNYSELPAIYESIISRYEHIKRWNIFEFTPLRGSAKFHKKEYSLSKEGNRYAETFLRKLVVKDGLSIRFKHCKAIRESYFIISPQGNVTIDGETPKNYGNLLKDDFTLIQNRLEINEKLYSKRIQNKSLTIV